MFPFGFGDNTAGGGGSTYQVARSLRFNDNDSAYLSRTPVTPTDAKKGTISVWGKRANLGGALASFGGAIYASDDAGASFVSIAGNASSGGDSIFVQPDGASTVCVLTALDKDVGQWGHLLIAIDTTQATAANRLKVYWNGNLLTSYSTDNRSGIAQNSSPALLTAAHDKFIGRYTASLGYLDAYLCEVYRIDGQALDPSYFGAIDSGTSQWVPVAYTGTFGNDGWYLDFSDNSNTTSTTLGKDRSANGNNWTPTNFSVSAGQGNDSLTDTPTDYDDGTVHGDFATIDPLNMYAGDTALANGDLDIPAGAPGVIHNYIASLPVKGFVGRMEVKFTAIGDSNMFVGLVQDGYPYPNLNGGNQSDVGILGMNNFSYGLWQSGPIKRNASTLQTLSAIALNDVIDVVYDEPNGTLKFYKAGVQIGTTITSLTGVWRFAVCIGDAGNGFAVNFGQRAFTNSIASTKGVATTNFDGAEAVVTSGSFTGNADANGPVVDCAGTPSVVTINGNAVTFGTHALKLANGFKVITSSTTHNSTGSNTWTATVPVPRKAARAVLN